MTSQSDNHKSNNYSTEIDPLSFLDHENYGTFNRHLAKTIGLSAAVLLAELISKRKYHKHELIHDKQHGPGWFYHTIEFVAERTGLSRKEQDTALRKLKERGLIEIVVFGIPPRRHFKLNDSAILEIFGLKINSHNLTERGKSICPKGANQSDQKGQITHIEKEPKEEPNLSVVDAGAPTSQEQEEVPDKEEVPHKAVILAHDGSKQELTESHLYARIVRSGVSLSSDQISYAWRALCAYNGPIGDWWQFFLGTAKNYQTKIKSKNITRGASCKNKTSNICKADSSATDSSEPPLPKLVSMKGFLDKWKNG